jgi:hypothetical protein
MHGCENIVNRPFQGRALSGARFPGALPPATASIPFGDSGWTVLEMSWGRKEQVNRLPAISG